MKQQRATLDSRVAGYVLQVRSQPLLLGGVTISSTNRSIFCRCLEMWLYLVEDLMLRSGFSEESRIQRMDNFVYGVVSSDLLDTLSFLDDVFLFLIGVEPTADGFKHLCDGSSLDNAVIRRLLSPINSVLYLFLDERDIKTKAYLCSTCSLFLRFPHKLVFQDIGLEEKAIAEYLETERQLETVDNDCIEDLDDLSNIIKEWFDDFHIGSLKPNHGPGSVAEGSLTLAKKFESLHVDDLMKIGLRNVSHPSSYMDFYPYPPGRDLSRISRTIFVPKTVSKLRTISMEPVSLQYIQQGVMKEIYRYIEHHPYLGVRIKLRDQTQNQILSLEGSKYGTYGTIDLSKASDTVRWSLVKRLFKPVPRLYKWLLITRSNRTLLPNGQTISLHKFAPMGSALCFPIECIVFAAIVEQASRKVCRRLHIEPRLWSVYGDDLVVPTLIYATVVRLLTQYGFIVNKRKSYWQGPYRESCGKDYYAGYDISALYYRIPFYNKRVTPDAYESLCSMANNAYLHSLPLLRLHVLHVILGFRRRFGPYFGYSPEVSPQLYSPEPTNFHVKTRWNRDYQRQEGRFTVVKSKRRDGELTDDTLSYFCKLIMLAWRQETGAVPTDESPSLMAMHGCVEFFSSTTCPIVPYIHSNRMCTVDWSGT